MISCPISVGELIDKITILEIKKKIILSDEAQIFIDNELNLLHDLLSSIYDSLPSSEELVDLHNNLRDINRLIWDNEDEKRRLDSLNCFDESFVEANKLSYRLNDERARIKIRINSITNSEIREFKNHALQK